MVFVKRILKKNQVMITALAIMIAVAGYLNFAGEKIGEEDFLTVDGSDSKLTYEMADISDEDMFAISLEDTQEGDITSLDSDDTTPISNYISGTMEMTGNSEESLVANADVSSTEGTEDESVDMEVPGEAVFTSTTAINSLAGAKLLKEQTRAQNKETLLEIINNESLTETAKQEAIDSMVAMTNVAEKETAAEMLLEAKGYTETVVSIGDGTVDVMVGTSTLTDTQTAQIMDIVQRKTEVAPENIIITVSSTSTSTSTK
jgi:stage III sporulation protein AH